MERVYDDQALQNRSMIHDTYKIKRLLASSELSKVYLVKDINQKRNRVMKEFFPQSLAIRDVDGRTVLCRQPKQKAVFAAWQHQFNNEAQLLSELDHPNILPYIEHFEANGTLYLVTQYIKGTSLDQTLPVSNVLDRFHFLKSIVLPVIDALHYIHQEGWLHRDIKPSNILVDKSGVPFMIDFGSAIKLNELDSNHLHTRNIVTTAGFSPLELYSAKAQLSPRSDVYSLAALIYYAFTDHVPPEAASRVIEDPIIPIKHLAGIGTPFMNAVIMRALSLQADKRPSLNQLRKRITFELAAMRWKAAKISRLGYHTSKNKSQVLIE